ncbi:hypothetical protein [Streptomyces sp. G-G2]|uniref:hypothetical protein n=1 Tax=Streptomyces sp. G-G2 TaxID=3046201 RepID=UPI0024BA53FF|nr:hypothetical protein [Streptomyces sp. G-G2]MDJ0382157.1 hypothetical protein [Streptomyces sp. G-G2]
MTSKTLSRFPAWSILARWATLTGILWLASTALGHRTPLAACAASAALLVAVGEAGDWLRRRWTAHCDSRSPR